MNYYIVYRAVYNLPYSPLFWADDFALGFRDGIRHVHFHFQYPQLSKEPSRSFNWGLSMIENDQALDGIWIDIVKNKYTERGERGIIAALLLESWRLKDEFTPGAIEYIKRHEQEYTNKYPDANQFQMDDWLIMSHFVIPLIEDDKIVHPLILEHFSKSGMLQVSWTPR